MPTTYAEHDDCRDMAAEQIRDYHPHLQGRRITCVERIADSISPEAVTAKLLSGLNRFLAGWDAVLVVDGLQWSRLNDREREAAVDHALSSLRDDGDGLYLRKPEAAEFADVILRRGLWRKDLRDMATVMAERVREQSIFEDGRQVDRETGEVRDVPVTLSTPDGQEVHTSTRDMDRVADAARGGRLRAVR